MQNKFRYMPISQAVAMSGKSEKFFKSYKYSKHNHDRVAVQNGTIKVCFDFYSPLAVKMEELYWRIVEHEGSEYKAHQIISSRLKESFFTTKNYFRNFRFKHYFRAEQVLTAMEKIVKGWLF
jgi:late competence protein required for DNA uptake (superfamily II DNA/RNA helicase)